MIARAITETVAMLEMILPSMFIGMLVANALYSVPQFRKLTKFRSGVAIVAFFAHKVVALSILADMRKKGLIEDREVVVATVIGMFPMGVRSVTLLLAPVAVSTLGFKLGLIFSFMELSSRFLVALIGAYLGRKYLVKGCVNYEFNKSLKSNVLDVIKQFFRVVAILVPTIFFITLLLNFGDIHIPQLAIVFAGAGSTIAGLGVAGSLLAKGEIDEETAMILLLVALAFHRIVENIRYSMPVNISLFGRSFGIKLTVVSLLMSELACFFSALILLLLITFNII